jgi:hypothetical protein
VSRKISLGGSQAGNKSIARDAPSSAVIAIFAEHSTLLLNDTMLTKTE